MITPLAFNAIRSTKISNHQLFTMAVMLLAYDNNQNMTSTKKSNLGHFRIHKTWIIQHSGDSPVCCHGHCPEIRDAAVVPGQVSFFPFKSPRVTSHGPVQPVKRRHISSAILRQVLIICFTMVDWIMFGIQIRYHERVDL